MKAAADTASTKVGRTSKRADELRAELREIRDAMAKLTPNEQLDATLDALEARLKAASAQIAGGSPYGHASEQVEARRLPELLDSLEKRLKLAEAQLARFL